ncbi:hypothetical protein [Moorena sp. SIO3B2]|uniref:hypothetical protein n=2 Tax=Moorena TaxID=1155738 RepID=UPI0005CACC57|nr:hypothetical protein [Moorena sp. SIO3B2]NEP33075.1 hypothetical protein [Moorena sp. SIO3B2]NEQ15359.1 hypothetical protein [Moorena sp. SIO3E2]OLT64031.1 hypothetical protein BI334_02400 [Moorena producens 3L]
MGRWPDGNPPLGRVFKLRVPPFPLKKGDFEYGSPLNKGGWGGSNILRKTLKTHPNPSQEGNMGRWGIRSVFPIPDSRFPIPDSRLPITDYRFPIPYSLPIRFPIPDSRFPILCTSFKFCDSIDEDCGDCSEKI